MIQRLLLFDIDQTLLSTTGAGKAALFHAAEEALGPLTIPPNYTLAGKTDLSVLRDLAQAKNWPTGELPGLVEKALLRYPFHLQEALARLPIAPLPGVVALLTELSAMTDLALGIFTGNIRSGAEAKLRAAGVNGFNYQVMVCADGAYTKAELLPTALPEIRARFGADFSPRQVLVIGDSPADVQSGLACGMCSLGVATGPFSLEALAACRPDYLLPSLADTSACLHIFSTF